MSHPVEVSRRAPCVVVVGGRYDPVGREGERLFALEMDGTALPGAIHSSKGWLGNRWSGAPSEWPGAGSNVLLWAVGSVLGAGLLLPPARLGLFFVGGGGGRRRCEPRASHG